uniref:Transmembrane protein 176l.4 n=1 Tax=Lepisosteus oculatus TaxID=7918 RepID=W5MR73_LEPOC|nr:PREDICTED: membrane-spanning 4-domains subfamily A member 5-like [Lepisosteus oculatus]
MSVSMTRGEGVTVFTLTSDTSSNWPLVCQLLRQLCCSPVCVVSHQLKQLFTGTQTALGTMQIIVGLFNIAFGVILRRTSYFIKNSDAPFWLGGLFIAAGVMCILGEMFPSPCLVFLTICMNLVSSGLGLTAIVLYSVDMARLTHNSWMYYCSDDKYRSWTTAPPDPEKQRIMQHNLAECRSSRRVLVMLARGLDISLIVFAVLQLCVALSASVLGIKALCKTKGKAKPEPEPDTSIPLLEEGPVV